mgnify:CR=1 FL=1
MAANPTNVPPAPPPPSDFVNVEVDGVPVKARKGAMIINNARGNVVDIPALAEALQGQWLDAQGRLIGALNSNDLMRAKVI